MITELTFHFPLEIGGIENTVVELADDEQALYRQLVCWCALQRYWYYVLDTPQVTDLEYDEVEALVAQCEEECSTLQNPFSPTRKPGSSRPEDYPYLIRSMFHGYKQNQGMG